MDSEWEDSDFEDEAIKEVEPPIPLLGCHRKGHKGRVFTWQEKGRSIMPTIRYGLISCQTGNGCGFLDLNFKHFPRSPDNEPEDWLKTLTAHCERWNERSTDQRIATLEAELRATEKALELAGKTLNSTVAQFESLQAEHTALVERADRFESLLRRYMKTPVPSYTRGKVTQLVDGEIHGRLALDIDDAFKKYHIPLDE